MSRTRPIRPPRRRGFAIFLALLVLLVVTIAALGLMFNTTAEQSMTGTETRISKTFYAAESGLSWGTESFRQSAAFEGGKLPANVSANTPGSTVKEIEVNVKKPAFVGFTLRSGDELQSQGSSYGATQVVEGHFELSSTATWASVKSEKTVEAEVVVYPHQLSPP